MKRLAIGPCRADWIVEYARPDGSRGSSGQGTRTGAHWDAAFYLSRGYSVHIERRETCPHPGCDGDGSVARRGRGGVLRFAACPAHRPAERVTEFHDPLVAREHWASLGYSVRERIDLALHNDIRLELLGLE